MHAEMINAAMTNVTKTNRRFRVLALAVALIAGIGASADVALAAPDLAVVDMMRLIESHPDTQTLDAKLKQATLRAKKSADDERKRLDKMRKEIELLSRGSPERLAKEKQFQQRMTNADFAYKWELKVARDRYVAALEETYQSLRAVVARYARMNNIKLVIQHVDPSRPINASEPQDFFLKLRLRQVVHFDKTVDITDAILAEVKKDAASRVPAPNRGGAANNGRGAGRSPNRPSEIGAPPSGR